TKGLERADLPMEKAAHQSLFLSLSKFPNFLGLLTYHLRRMRGADMRIIEYK
ncbi:MAG TPA: glycosyltransferase family 2 protein, partial [Armatimonadetes bacterium]|nr:glycosyltransferase family 2 protein [Armatimonadota bacterium]